MIQEPHIDDLVKVIGSKFALCVVASKRARQILEIQNQKDPSEQSSVKPLSVAAQEIYDGKLIATND